MFAFPVDVRFVPKFAQEAVVFKGQFDPVANIFPEPGVNRPRVAAA